MVTPLIVDANIFEEKFVPDSIVSRKKEIKKIMDCLRPARNGDCSVFAYVHGDSGTGKTAIVKSILKKHFPNNSVYINCFRDRTKHDIMEEVLLQSGFFVHGNHSVKDMIKRFENSQKKIIVCLDECEKIKNPDIIEVFSRNGCGVIMITDKPLSESKITKKIKSHASLDEIEFEGYSKEEIIEIIKDRADQGLQENAIDEDTLSEISKICNGNVTMALQTLRMLVRNSDDNNMYEINSDNLRIILEKAKRHSAEESLSALNQQQRMILEILRNHKRLPSGDLFRIYQSKSKYGANDRSYRNYMMTMKQMGLVKESGNTKGRMYEAI